MEHILDNLAANLTDFAIYLAIGLVMLTGLVKCVFPLLRGARRLRRGIHLLETSTGEGRPVWQDVLFLGKELQGPWRRFLVNAEQLDARGLNCNVEDYVNDDTVIDAVGHPQLAEVVPGLLTSLGILGTFIGLMRGLSGLETENTCAAFVAAGNRSYFGIETDVHRTLDGQFVVIHDDDTLRVSGKLLPVEGSTLAQLRAITLHDWDGRPGRGDVCIPTLAEYIQICKKI